MIINKNSSNSIVFTLQEKVTLASPYYLFRLISQTTKEEVLFNASPISSNTRFDLFTIIETGTSAVNLSAGTVNLSPTGFWWYQIYEQDSATNRDLNYSGITVELENGIIKVSGSSEYSYTQYTGNSAVNYTYYNS